MRPSNPPGNVTLFKNLESVATAPQLLEEIHKTRVCVGGNAPSLAWLDRSPKFEIAAQGACIVRHASAPTIKTQIGHPVRCGTWGSATRLRRGSLCLALQVQDHLLASAAHGFGSSRPAWRNHGNDGATMKRTGKGKRKIDWSRVDAMTKAERHAAAMADPDARPMTDKEWARAPRVPTAHQGRRAFTRRACPAN